MDQGFQSLQLLGSFREQLFDFDPFVVDRAVRVRAEYVHGETALALLALPPEVLVLSSEGFDFQLFGDRDFQVFCLAARTEGLVGTSGAVSAGGLDSDEFAQEVVFVDFWDISIFCTLPGEEGFDIWDNVGVLEDPLERRTDLLLNVVVVVDGYFFLEDANGVFCVFVVFGPLGAFHHDVLNAVTDVDYHVFVSALHLGGQLGVCLFDLVSIF